MICTGRLARQARRLLGAAGVAAVLALASAPAPALAGELPFTAKELLALKTIIETRISPDGTGVLYVVSSADLAANRYESKLWQVAADGSDPHRISQGRGDESSPRWSPDGERLAYLSTDGGSAQIWTVARSGGEPRKLTNVAAGVQAFDWSPDGRRIAFIASEASPAEPPIVKLVGVESNLARLFLLDPVSGAVEGLTDGAFMVEDFSWSPDGQRIAFTRRSSTAEPDDYQTDVAVLRLADHAVSPIALRPGRNATPKWSHDGTRIAFLSTRGETGEYASAHVMAAPADGGAIRDLTPSLGERVYDFFGWSPDDRTVYLKARAGVGMHVFATDVRSGRTSRLTTGERVYDSVSFSEKGEPLIALVATDASTPKDLYVSPVAAFRPRRIVISNPGFQRFRMPVQRVVRWKGRDGLELEGLLTLPIGYEPGHRYPLLVTLHGGPSAAFSASFAPQFGTDPAPQPMEVYPPQLYAEAGFAMFMPNIRGSGGYGEAFRKSDIGDWGGADLEDVLSGVDAMVAQGVADPDRLGVLGWSYGGFMTAFILTRTDRFKAASVGAGVSDLFSMYGVTDQPDQIRAYFGGTPLAREALYRSRSAVFFADRIKTPTLIQQGEEDPAVPPGQADELYRALLDRGVPVQYARYPRSGHAPTEPKQNQDVWLRNLAWFQRWLQPETPK